VAGLGLDPTSQRPIPTKTSRGWAGFQPEGTGHQDLPLTTPHTGILLIAVSTLHTEAKKIPIAGW
jgi:hypothetical protein